MAGKKTLLNLAKSYDFEYEYEYFEYIADSYINGQKQQVKNLFNQMRPADKKECLQYINNMYPNISNWMLTNIDQLS